MEYWLQGLERVSKATLLGHCLPMLVTTMTHPNLRCLSIADALMPQLVQLVVLTSQVCGIYLGKENSVASCGQGSFYFTWIPSLLSYF